MFRNYRRRLRVGYVLLSTYLVFAVLSPLHLIEAQEVFPFFSWSLFSSPKSEATFYTLLLDRDGRATPAAPELATKDGRVRLVDSELNRHVSLTKVLGSYSREASGSRDPARVYERYRPKIDAIVRDEAPRYHLFETVYDPIQLFQERRYRKTRYIGTYEPSATPEPEQRSNARETPRDPSD